MNQFIVQENVISSRDECRGSISGLGDPLVCPKPRRLGPLNASSANDQFPVWSLRRHVGHEWEHCDVKSGADFLDTILIKGGGFYGVEQCTPQQQPQVASSPPPFFCGSPPSRVGNPLTQDARFGDERFFPLSPLSPIQPPLNFSSSSSSSPRKGVCVRANFGSKPAVRVEGFDCLDRDRRNCSIPALA